MGLNEVKKLITLSAMSQINDTNDISLCKIFMQLLVGIDHADNEDDVIYAYDFFIESSMRLSLSYQQLHENAQDDLLNYMNQYVIENEEVACEYPVWVADLEDCKSSLEIMDYMQEFGWSKKCISDNY